MENAKGNTVKPSQHVLVVENEEIIQITYRNVVFKGLACTMNLVATGKAALAALATTQYDLIILDYGLPDINGAEVCRRIQQDRSLGHQNQPIIMASASGHIVEQECVQAGAKKFFVKTEITTHRFRKTVIEYLKGTCVTATLPFTVSDHANRQKETIYPTKPATTTVDIKAVNVEQPTVSTEKVIATVLLVEDTAIAAIAVKTTLKSLGCAVDVAKTGEQAVRIAQRGAYHLIVMDIGLPDFSGIEVTKKIRAFSNPEKANVPIVALTAHAGNPDKRQEALDAGMQEVLNKPAQPRALESALKRYVFKKSDAQTAKLITVNHITPEFERAVVDWSACVRMCQDNADMAQQLLSVLARDLKETTQRLETDYANKNTIALRETLRRMRGDVCYLKVPQLECALKKFHLAIQEKLEAPQQVEKTYTALQHAIAVFLETWKTFIMKK